MVIANTRKTLDGKLSWRCWSSCRYVYTGAVALAHVGNESKPNIGRPQLLMAREMVPMPIMFITTPVFACEGGPRRLLRVYGDFSFPALLRSKTHHVWHFEKTIGEDNSIRRRGHGQHEGEGCAECAGDHHIQRIQAYRLRLDENTEKQLNAWRFKYRKNNPSASPAPTSVDQLCVCKLCLLLMHFFKVPVRPRLAKTELPWRHCWHTQWKLRWGDRGWWRWPREERSEAESSDRRASGTDQKPAEGNVQN